MLVYPRLFKTSVVSISTKSKLTAFQSISKLGLQSENGASTIESWRSWPEINLETKICFLIEKHFPLHSVIVKKQK